MERPTKAAEPFRFYTRLNLTELTGLRASSLWQMARDIKNAPAASIYHHTHRFLQQRQYHSPEPPNDFAYWVTNAVGEQELGEELASIDIARFRNIEDLRGELVGIIERHLRKNFLDRFKFVDRNETFYFMKSVSFILPTEYVAASLKDLAAMLRNVTADSIYFHTFEARMRLGYDMDDFSNWIKNSVGNKKLADEISRLDPYTHTIEELRAMMIRLIEREAGA